MRPFRAGTGVFFPAGAVAGCGGSTFGDGTGVGPGDIVDVGAEAGLDDGTVVFPVIKKYPSAPPRTTITIIRIVISGF